jgi:hypothetical protein
VVALAICSSVASAQDQKKGFDWVDFFARLMPVYCTQRGPSPVLRARDRIRETIGSSLAPAELQRIDSLATFWDGPQGCRVFPADSLAKIRQRGDSIDSAKLRAARVQGLSELRWTMREGEVERLLGTPTYRIIDTVASSSSMAWKRTVLGKDAVVMATFDRRIGLVETSYVFSALSGLKCTALFDEIRAAVDQKFSGVAQAQERITNKSVTGMSLCDAVGIERATANVRWSDSVSSVDASVGINTDQKVLVLYSTATSRDIRTFRQWVEKRKAF